MASLARQLSVEVRCIRCSGPRWIPAAYQRLDRRGRAVGRLVDLQALAGYLCLRCRAVVLGRNVSDPLVTDLARARTAAATAARRLMTTDLTLQGPRSAPDPIPDPSSRTDGPPTVAESPRP